MSGRVKLVIAVVVVVLVCLLLFLFVIRPRQSELSDVEAEVDAATAEQVQLQNQLEVLRDLQDRAPELQADLEEIRGLVPESAELPSFIFQVQEAANLSGVGVVQIQPELPKQPPEGGQLAEVRTVIRAQGDYFAIQDFVRRLYDVDRALRIDTLALGQPGSTAETTGTTTGTTGAAGGGTASGAGEIEINMAARVFFQLPVGGAGGAAAPTETTPTAPESPGASPAPAPTDAGSPAPQTTP